MMLTNDELREYLRKNLEYPRGCHPSFRGSLLVKIAHEQLENADDKTKQRGYENLIKLSNRLQPFHLRAKVKKEGLTLDELSRTLQEFLPTMDNILWYKGKNIGHVIDEFIGNMCECCGFDTI